MRNLLSKYICAIQLHAKIYIYIFTLYITQKKLQINNILLPKYILDDMMNAENYK